MSGKPLSSQASGWVRSDGVAALLILILASIPFVQVASFSFVSYDDPLHVFEQPMVLSGLNKESIAWSLGATPSNLWHPLTWISYMAEVSFLGGGADNPEIHHLGNLILHLGATLFFFLLLRSLRISMLVAVLVTLVFSLHPLHVEPVAWISSRKDTLCAFFSLLSLFSYSQSQRSERNTRCWFWITLIAMVAALASKPSAVILPGLFVLIDYLPREGDQRPKVHGLIQNMVQKWPHFTVAALAAIVTITVQYSGSHEPLISQQSLWSRLSLIPASLGFYLQHTLWPSRLCFDYATPTGEHFIILTIFGAVLLLGISALSCMLRQRFPAIMTGWLWFILCLAPVLGFFYVGSSFTSDRYTYLALAGPALTLAMWVDSFKGGIRTMALAGLLLIAALLGATSYQQTKVWKNDDSLFTHGVTVEPGSDLAQTNFARVCSLKGRDALALVHYNKALMLDASRHYLIYCNIALIQYQRGKYDEAIQSCRLSLESYNHYAPSHHLYGQLLEKQGGHYDEALHHLEQACLIGEQQHDASTANYAYSCGLAYAKRGQYAKAEHILQNAAQASGISRDDRRRINVLLKMLEPYLSK